VDVDDPAEPEAERGEREDGGGTEKCGDGTGRRTRPVPQNRRDAAGPRQDAEPGRRAAAAPGGDAGNRAGQRHQTAAGEGGRHGRARVRRPGEQRRPGRHDRVAEDERRHRAHRRDGRGDPADAGANGRRPRVERAGQPRSGEPAGQEGCGEHAERDDADLAAAGDVDAGVVGEQPEVGGQARRGRPRGALARRGGPAEDHRHPGREERDRGRLECREATERDRPQTVRGLPSGAGAVRPGRGSEVGKGAHDTPS
jgi:hypothetical protein